ncbi:MAG: phospho-N-acetylmuramoyl-pentapeptide-transferase [Negativibacillus massiliensis]|jgi:phospho-N-acetylmuramoyl-pentapeptide-transferase|uniref:phospho-N-acetylmuramoyl-pentapeptide- transferase n=1 Tax=Negativibacillus massiliensis TaxID=1871035 RepID=UPI0009789500|nr:phospho-N-acetylmuramoyl-pentapeptide-transferase [Negativibacillus massiliensis]MCI6347413.1 phospho-N-acetylmuramoyl-pentapeptide-transferase [Negativibacillus massiliensis]MDY4046513.1 phospho-N-acetylmuramoyl-pentapeptide-transferase [Negativibacillus massiliensis]
MNFIGLLVTLVAAFLLSSVIGVWLIPFLHKLHYGQTILDIGPAWHKSKQGTPTMGGIMFIIGSILACAAGWCTIAFSAQGLVDASSHGTFYLVGGFLMALGFGVIGFLDDYIKVVKKRNLGLKAWQKSAAQLLVAVIYLIAERIFAPNDLLWIPFAGEFSIGWFYYPLMLFIIIGAVNAVNLTDGVDGLAASVTMVAAMGFMLIAAIQSFTQMDLMAAALAGGCLGFLVWNFHPAKVFMGDTGSMFLGGMVVALAFGLRKPVLLLFIGIVYVVETMSDIIQIGSVKLTGKRVFKMAPIHHHFEMCGWSEVKIVVVFSAVTALGCLIAVLSLL